MSDGGCIPMARELRREAPETDPHAALRPRLAQWRAEMGFNEVTLVYLLGIGAETCERIERGEVDPAEDLAERIAQMFDRSPVRFPHSPASPCAADVSPATITAGSEGGAAHSPLVSAAPLLAPESPGLVPRPSFWLAKADKSSKSPEAFHVEMLLDGTVYCFPIKAAEGMLSDLHPLVAIARDPARYERQPRLARPEKES